MVFVVEQFILDENKMIGCSLEQWLLLYPFYVICYKINEEKFEKIIVNL